MEVRPDKSEYPPNFDEYVKLVPQGKLISMLHAQMQDTYQLLHSITEEIGHYRYAPGKWSIKETIGHLIDFERIMGCRLLCISRGDDTPLAGYDHEHYVEKAFRGAQSVPRLLFELMSVRQATIYMLDLLPHDAWSYAGIVNNNNITVRALAYIIAGHELHHRAILKQRYLHKEGK